MISNFSILDEAKKIFEIEIEALNRTKDSLDENFVVLVELVVECKGKVVLTGMGKPGHIGTKIAATLASLGTPSFFMHPGEALHGDLGMIEKEDIVILMSYSGESDEITRLMPTLHEIGCKTVAITGKPKSTLARECKYHIYFPEFEEACYMGLAPTSSTTALLVVGDALAVTAARVKNYTREDFGLHHPAGALGKRLLVRVENVMHGKNENATVLTGSSLKQAIVEMSSKGLSMVSVVDARNKLLGVITDGDLRRMLEKGTDVYNETIDNVMTREPKWIDVREMAVNALQMMTDLHITGMPVLNENKEVTGTILMQDIYKAGLV